MEVESRLFYLKAAARATDARLRELLDDLAQEEYSHENRAEQLEKTLLPLDTAQAEDQARRRLFVLQVVQPGLAGLMDGSVSTLAPVFAAALATHNSWAAFAVGMAASLGAGISMGFAEALSDDGSLTGRGHPWVRGVITGIMTALGGVGHTLPFLLHDFGAAMGARRWLWWWSSSRRFPGFATVTWIRPSGLRRCKWDWAARWCFSREC